MRTRRRPSRSRPPTDIDVDGKTAYLAFREGVAVVDIDDPTAPAPLGLVAIGPRGTSPHATVLVSPPDLVVGRGERPGRRRAALDERADAVAKSGGPRQAMRPAVLDFRGAVLR